MFTEIDHQKFRNLRITHVATRFEELISDEANDELTPEQIFLTAVDDALDQRQAHRIDMNIRLTGVHRYCLRGPVAGIANIALGGQQ